jgi:hypothetical protein
MKLSEVETIYRQRVNQFRANHPDFDKIVGQDNIPLDMHLQLELKLRPDGPGIAYWLGKNPQIAFSLVDMDARAALKQIILSRISQGVH